MPKKKRPTHPSAKLADHKPIDSACETCKKCKCPKYQTVDRTKDVEQFNCAGLAHRTYTFIGDVNQVKQMLAVGRKIDCSGKCSSCQVKHWLWEYELAIFDVEGNRLTEWWRDFHTVAGLCDPEGNDPADVYSKNGKRPLEGPARGSSFRPPEKDQATRNDRSAQPMLDGRGRPIYKIRRNIDQTCYCLPCPA